MFKSIKSRFILSLGFFILISETVLLITSIGSLKRVGEVSSRNTGRPVVEKTISIIDGDRFEKLAKSLDESDPYYEQLRLEMLAVKKSAGCSFLYTMAKTDDGKFVYVVDGSCDPSDEENFSPLGEEEDLESWGNAPLKSFADGSLNCSDIEEQEEWGWQVSVYQGIKNSKGEVVGMVGCDISVDFLVKYINSQTLVVSIMAAAFLVLGVVVVWLFTRIIFTSMKKVSSAMAEISEGEADLSKRIPETGGKEIKILAQSCNKVIARLDSLVADLQQHTEVLNQTGTELYDKMSEHIDNISKTASGVSEIDMSVNIQSKKTESLESSVNSVEMQIQKLGNMLSSQSDAVRISSEAIEKITDDIQNVNDKINYICNEYESLVKESEIGQSQLKNVADLVSRISEQSKHLNEANVAISNIASQTNLLAMNAAIEASHAGVAGKGFNVVAGEIRSLATTSQKQSQSIADLLKDIHTLVDNIVESSNVSTKSFDTLNGKISDMENLMHQVQGVINGEKDSVDNITTTMGTLNSATEQIQIASESMQKESSKLFTEINDLQQMSESTRKRSSEVSSAIAQMKEVAQQAAKSSAMNRDASKSVVDMINGFTV
ncbi:MAG: methyl-accepting chemotaxis protein [Treponemataceae bacterium]|nr:methyl-accepting chemotaxis protein [Treponemataceae bacterium]